MNFTNAMEEMYRKIGISAEAIRLGERAEEACAAHFAEIDWVFLTNRSSMQTGYRRQEALARIRDFAEGYLDWMESDLETTYRERYDDLHMLFGAVCCLSELQLALPGEIRTTIPMKNVLDRRPFI